MTSNPDWIREREIDREIQARDEQVDRQYRELRESEVQQQQQQQPSIPYESSKRHSRNIRTSAPPPGQLCFDSPTYENVEGEELPYIVTDEDAQHLRVGGGGVAGARYNFSFRF